MPANFRACLECDNNRPGRLHVEIILILEKNELYLIILHFTYYILQYQQLGLMMVFY
jgi:hypothetical protein